MSFLDNLENSLKSLETGSEREEGIRDQDRRKADVAAQKAVAPWADQLRKSAYTEELLKVATREGFQARMKVYITWLGTTLRLEARERRLEFRPAQNGIDVSFVTEGAKTDSRLIDLTGDPGDLVREWLG